MVTSDQSASIIFLGEGVRSENGGKILINIFTTLYSKIALFDVNKNRAKQNQSINQLINQSINQKTIEINQLISHPINQSVD